MERTDALLASATPKCCLDAHTAVPIGPARTLTCHIILDRKYYSIVSVKARLSSLSGNAQEETFRILQEAFLNPTGAKRLTRVVKLFDPGSFDASWFGLQSLETIPKEKSGKQTRNECLHCWTATVMCG
ncbi:hypothetical protein CIHG_05336 [Coccidioides immitis H538.4]|uniref:Uncharacterized protein n=3 Tax=Coccidioides immitis TaxID=5501 RepID=A0A0J8R510_COCIT|nr:hypothetical protein CIRG_02116 [Coccidioides immitis RMSCC 2394]KMU79871.1 hypothetical protein CISG_07943 [Coccidioides immitis RMSCC 3703]KMU88165.1 hypothetical protein CIHG_05336 [Coccidioides immitis H538.4]